MAVVLKPQDPNTCISSHTDITLDPTAAIFKTAGEGVGLTCKLNVDTAYPTRAIAWTSGGEAVSAVVRIQFSGWDRSKFEVPNLPSMIRKPKVYV